MYFIHIAVDGLGFSGVQQLRFVVDFPIYTSEKVGCLPGGSEASRLVYPSLFTYLQWGSLGRKCIGSYTIYEVFGIHLFERFLMSQRQSPRKKILKHLQPTSAVSTNKTSSNNPTQKPIGSMYVIFTYVHLPQNSTKCRSIYHTWMVWEIETTTCHPRSREAVLIRSLRSFHHRSRNVLLRQGDSFEFLHCPGQQRCGGAKFGRAVDTRIQQNSQALCEGWKGQVSVDVLLGECWREQEDLATILGIK